MKERLSAAGSAVLETTKTTPLLALTVLFLWLIAAIPPVYSEEGPKSKLFLKSGRIIDCDEVWRSSKDIVRCKKGSGTSLYSIDDVELEKTFGQASDESAIPRDEEKKPPSTFAQVGAQREQRFKIGPAFHSFNYEEPGLMELDGSLYGVIGSYMHRISDGLGFTLSLSYAFGSDTDYTGSTWGGTPVTAKADDYIVEFRGLLGYSNFFAGIGYRYWNNWVKATGGYEREILYCYVPIGIEASSPLSEKWTWGIQAEYDYFVQGKVYSYLSEAIDGYNNPEVDQYGGYGYRFSVEFKRELTNLHALSIEPFYIYWDIDESDPALLTQYGVPKGYVIEPENETENFGIQVNFYF
jgi:hypothetical protein